MMSRCLIAVVTSCLLVMPNSSGAQASSGDVTFRLPLNLTQLSSDLAKIAVFCRIRSTAISRRSARSSSSAAAAGTGSANRSAGTRRRGSARAARPDLDEEISSAQAQAAKSQVIEKVRSGGLRRAARSGAGRRQSIARSVAPERRAASSARNAVRPSPRKRNAAAARQADGSTKFCPEAACAAADVTDDTRRAGTSWALEDAAGRRIQAGQSEAVIDDEGLGVGTARIAFVDADALHAVDYRVELDLWPAGRLVLTELGRRFESFARALRQARNQARIAGLLTHAPSTPEVFEGALLAPQPSGPIELQVYSTHITIVSADADPWQVPLGALDDVTAGGDDPPSVVLKTGAGNIAIGRLARRRDAFQAAVSAQRNAHAQLLATYTNRSAFAMRAARILCRRPEQ